MKNILLLFLLGVFFCTANVNAQTANYTSHTIVKGETLTAIAKKYHTTVGEIMRLNGMSAKSQLKIGEKIKIPASSSATAQKTTVANNNTKTIKNDSEVATHYVLKNETLYSISKQFGVTVEQLKEWNNLTDDNLHFGQLLAVSSEGATLLTAKKNGKPAITTNTSGNQVKPSVNTKDANASGQNPNPVISAKAVNTGVTSNGSDSYFARFFSVDGNKSLKSLTGYATVFKTTSGWEDKKYYIMMNNIPSGTVVKVSSPNGNSIYAKVLWSLDDVPLNHGLNFRINDAAASALALNQPTFSLMVQYFE